MSPIPPHKITDSNIALRMHQHKVIFVKSDFTDSEVWNLKLILLSPCTLIWALQILKKNVQVL